VPSNALKNTQMRQSLQY
jgi:hypothetical protein